MPCPRRLCIALSLLNLVNFAEVDAKSGGHVSASPAILRLEKYGGSYKEMCPTAFYVSKSRLPSTLAKAVAAPLVDMMPSDGCPSMFMSSAAVARLNPAADLEESMDVGAHEGNLTTPAAVLDSDFMLSAIPGLTASGTQFFLNSGLSMCTRVSF